MDWSGERYQDMLDTGQEFTSLPLVSHRVGRWVERVGGGVKSSCGVELLYSVTSPAPTCDVLWE